jgi:cell division protein FtsI (penicillin-binding protein 3)
MRRLLLGVVEKGTGKMAKIDSLVIGGKTGTSKIIVNGKYSDDLYCSSFIGFYPVDSPQIVCYVLINKPKGHYYGGLVAAPVFKNIVERIFALEKIKSGKPILNTDIKTVNSEMQDVKEELVSYDLRSVKHLSESKNIFISDNSRNIMPDLKGKTLKEALLILNQMGILCSISGSGVVIEQSIVPSSAVKNRKTCRLTCSQVSTAGARIY